MLIREVMTADPACCVRTDSVQAAAIIMRELNVGVVPVVDSETSHKLVGLITDRDLCMEVVAAGENPREMPVEDCMVEDLITCQPDDEVEDVVQLMQINQVRRVPVVDDDYHLVGIVSTADLILCSDLPAVEIDEALRDISEPTFAEFQQFCALGLLESDDTAGKIMPPPDAQGESPGGMAPPA